MSRHPSGCHDPGSPWSAGCKTQDQNQRLHPPVEGGVLVRSASGRAAWVCEGLDR